MGSDFYIFSTKGIMFEVFERVRSMPSGEKVNIIVGEEVYRVNRSYAATLSPKFSKELNINPSLEEIRLNNFEDPNKDFLKFINNEKTKDSGFMLKLGIAFGNKDIIEMWKKQEGNQLI